MSDTLRAKIALDGGDDVKRQLDALGQSGRQAFQQISDATRQASQGLGALGSNGSHVLSSLASDLATVGKLFGALAVAGAAVNGLFNALGAAAARSTNKLVDTAKALKTTTDQVQRLQFAAGAAGVGESQMSGYLDKLKTKFDAATKSAQNHFRAVGDLARVNQSIFASSGVSVLSPAKNGQGQTNLRYDGLIGPDAIGNARDYQTALQHIGETLAGMEEGPRKDAFIEQLSKTFGEEFPKQAEDLAEKIKTTGEVFDKLGIAETDHAKEVSSAWEDSFHRLSQNISEQKTIISATISGVMHDIGILFTPRATAGQDAISDFIEKHRLDIPDFVAKYIRPAIAAIQNFVADHDFSSWGGLTQVAGDLFSGVATAASAAWDRIKQIAVSAWGSILSTLTGATGTGDLWGAIRARAVSAWEWLRGYIISTWASIKARIDGVDFAGVWSEFETRARVAWIGIVTMANDAYVAIRTAALRAFPGLTGIWTQMEGIGRSVLTTLEGLSGRTWLAIGGGLLALVLLWRGSFAAMLAATIPFWAEVAGGADVVAPAAGAALSPLRAVVTSIFGEVLGIGRAAWAFLRALWTGDKAEQAAAFAELRVGALAIWEQVKAAFVDGVAFIRAQIERAFPGAGEFFSGLETNARRLLTAVRTVGEGFATFLRIISGGKIDLGPWETIFALIGAQMLGISPIIIAISGAFLGLIEVFGTLVSVSAELFVLFATNPMAWVLAAVIALGVGLYELYQHWDEVKAAAVRAWEAMKQGAAGAWEAIKAKSGEFWSWLGEKWDSLKTLASPAWDALKQKASDAWDGIKTKTGDVWDAIKAKVSDTLTAIGESPVWKGIEGAASAVWNAISAAASVAVSKIGGFFSDIVGKVTGATASALEKAQQIASAIQQAIQAAQQAGGAGNLAAALVVPFESAAQTISSILETIAQKADAVVARIASAFSALRGLPGAFSGAPANDNGASPSIAAAGGGLLSGPGTGTSDSIFAMLSNGEFVVNARAVAAVGPAFLHTINNLQFPGFAMGGLIGAAPIAIPRFAEGGLASSPSHAGVIAFTLDQGGRSYDLMGQKDTVRELQRHSVISRMSSTTKRAPSWKNG